MGNYTEQLTRIEHYLGHDEFELGTMLCGKVMGFLLKDILEQYLLIADEKQRTNVRSFISARRKIAVEKLTAGEIVTLFLKINVVESLAKRLSLDVETFGLLNLREMVDIRNKTTHTAVQDEMQEKADAYVMYGNLLRLSMITNRLLLEAIDDIKDRNHETVAIPRQPTRVPRRVIVSEKHVVAPEPCPPYSLTLLRNKSSGDHFIYIQDISPTKILLVSPNGSIEGREVKLYDEPIEMKEELAVNKRIVNEEQIQKFQDFMAADVQQIKVARTVTKPATPRGMESPNYQRSLGTKGYTNLEDYLIPVIKSMIEGSDYGKAFHAVANKLDVHYSTVSAQCTRALDLTTAEFVSMVKEGKIIDLLKRKYPDQVAFIKRELVKPR